MTMWEEQLERLATARHLVDVWRDALDSDPITGLIALRSPELVVLQEVNGDAEYDGIEILQVADITRMRWGIRELESVQRLMTSSATVVPELVKVDLTSIVAAIESVNNLFGYVGLRFEGVDSDYLIGEVLELDETRLRLRAYGTKQSLDRYEVMVRLDAVTRIEADGKYERRLISLFRND